MEMNVVLVDEISRESVSSKINRISGVSMLRRVSREKRVNMVSRVGRVNVYRIDPSSTHTFSFRTAHPHAPSSPSV
jgi:hypothetical protein